MKILLDESLPRKLKADFGTEHEVWSVRDKGWLGMKNGALLQLMVAANFDLFVTIDRNLPYQQNTAQLPITVIVLCATDNRRETLSSLVPKIFERLASGNFQKMLEIDEECRQPVFIILEIRKNLESTSQKFNLESSHSPPLKKFSNIQPINY